MQFFCARETRSLNALNVSAASLRFRVDLTGFLGHPCDGTEGCCYPQEAGDSELAKRCRAGSVLGAHSLSVAFSPAPCSRQARHSGILRRELARVVARHLRVVPPARMHDAGQVDARGGEIVSGAYPG